MKNHHRNFCLSKQEVFRKLPVQKTGKTGPGSVPASGEECRNEGRAELPFHFKERASILLEIHSVLLSLSFRT